MPVSATTGDGRTEHFRYEQGPWRWMSPVPLQPTTRSHQTADASLVGALSIIAHDLRGPLANISLLLEMVEARCSESDATDALPLTKRAGDIVDGMTGLLNAMLARARSSGDPLTYHPSVVAVHEVIERSVAINQASAERKSIRLAAVAEPTLTIPGDAHMLVQALDNLINNAVAHSPEGSRVVCEAVGDGDVIVISVSDEAPQLDAEQIGRMFRPFSSIGARRQDGRASCGLGLWIVRLIAERHGGRVCAEQRPDGVGNVFALTLPARIDGAENPRPAGALQ